MSVAFGVQDPEGLDDPEEEVAVNSFLVHPLYNNDIKEHDLAVLVLNASSAPWVHSTHALPTQLRPGCIRPTLCLPSYDLTTGTIIRIKQELKKQTRHRTSTTTMAPSNCLLLL
jgi:hypothetical protein